MRDVTGLFKRSIELLEWIEQQPPTADDSGATPKLYKAAVEAGVYSGQQTGFAAQLKTFEERGLIARKIHGKRCTFITAMFPWVPEDAPAEPAPTAVDSVPAASSQLDVVETPSDAQVVSDELPARQQLTARVQLQLDVDTTTARLVLDLVDGTDGVQPVTRDDVAAMFDRVLRKLDAASQSTVETMQQRLAQLEKDRDGMAVALRKVDDEQTARKVDRSKIERPDFRRLGVSDSSSRKLMTDLACDGWTFEKTNNGHVKAKKPGYAPIQIAATPSDSRTTKNERARFRQAGAAV